MAIRELRTRYAGTLAGFFWSVINPLMIIVVYWIVFSGFFRVQPAGNIPFIVVFLCGMLPWTLFSESLISSTNSIVANTNLVKKTLFPTEILPFVNFFAGLITQGIMLVILVVVLYFSKIPFSVYDLQFIYYLIAMSVFTIGLSWISSSLNVFYRDTGQILAVIINIWFWLTPIVWMMNMVPKSLTFFFTLNPMYYIVEGYRNSFIYQTPFWQDYTGGLYFWAVSIAVFILGAMMFRKLKPEFPDVL
jgi:lipopolysaccharide transport system permease protein/teichoic acid transport system permease protein